MWFRALPIALAFVAVVLPQAGRSVDGVTEISAYSLSAGGYPIIISQSGSYRLTGSLSGFDNNTDAILIQADEVALDLNGFSITGPGVIGSGIGIDASGSARVVIRNGFVRGIGDVGILAGTDALVEQVAVSNCGTEGIAAGPGGLVRASQSADNGSFGLALAADTGYVDNVLRGNAAAGVSGGVSLGGNLCDGLLCSSPPRRGFYLTKSAYTGNGIIGAACANGYHFASLWEIVDPSSLAYDTTLGHTRADSGSGPPSPARVPEPVSTSAAGWIRTGSASDAFSSGAPGQINCGAWGSGASPDEGTTAALHNDWSVAPMGVSPWFTESYTCDALIRVWCVQD